jgi:hypothetical protein
VLEGQESKEGSVMSPERVETWVHQFGHEHADAALKLAQRIHMVGRDAIVGALGAFLTTDAGGEFRGASLTPLGDAKDSSALTTYYAGDRRDMRVRNLSEALREGSPIVFAEDFVGTGAQTISIFETWLGRPLSKDLHEQREGPLPPQFQEALKSQPLALVYAAGSPAGARAVEEAAAKMGLELRVYLHNEQAPTAFGDAESAFRERCEEIGAQLLVDDDPEHDEEWVAKRVLGYGNEGFLVVFAYNTPTQALTCLWKEGKVDGVPWIPLIPRRPKE